MSIFWSCRIHNKGKGRWVDQQNRRKSKMIRFPTHFHLNAKFYQVFSGLEWLEPALTLLKMHGSLLILKEQKNKIHGTQQKLGIQG